MRLGCLGWAGIVGILAASPQAEAHSQPPRPDRASAEDVLDVPYLPQTEALCGAAAAAMVMRYWGAREIAPQSFASLLRGDGSGIATADLATSLNSRGWRAFDLAGSVDSVKHHLRRGRPVIALVARKPRAFHYVVIIAWTTREVLYHDPADLPFRRESPQSFERSWADASHSMLLVLPGAKPMTSIDHHTAAYDVTASASPSTALLSTDCRQSIDLAVALADRKQLPEASTRLMAAHRACPESAAPLTELASLRLLELQYDKAAELATQAGRRSDADTHTWQVLGTTEFLRRRPDRALDAWNRSREPVLDLVQVRGLERTRYRTAVQSLDLAPGTMLTAATLARAQLRMTEVPAFDAARIEYVPVGDGLAEVTASVVEKSRFGSLSPVRLAATVARAVSDREAAWRISSLTKSGETITAAWRWWENRPQVAVDARIPVYGAGIGGILHIAGVIAEQPYDVSTTPSATTIVREHRRSASVALSDWTTHRLRWSVGGGVDRWKGRGVFGRVGGSIERRVDGNRGAMRIAADGWPASDAFGRIVAGLGWRSTASPAATGVLIAAGATHVTKRSPLDLWPGAGTGQARDELLRAHPLLEDGIVSSAAFGRQLVHATSELRFPIWSSGMLRLGGAGFVDAARAWNGPSAGGTLIDAGGGLRLHLSGEGTLRVDFARSATDGARAVSLAWERRWPRWEQ